MILKNKETGLELIFDTNESIKLKDLYPDKFDLTAETDEEKELLKNKEIVEAPLKDKLLGGAETALDVKKAEALNLGITAEDDDTVETLQEKIDVEVARLKEAKAAFAALKKEAKKLKVEVAKDDTFETLKVKVEAKKGE